MRLLPLCTLVCLTAAVTVDDPSATPGATKPALTKLLRMDDESLLRALASEPTNVIEHIRAQQRRIDWLEQQLEQAAAELEAEELKRATQLHRKSVSPKQRAAKTLRMLPTGCSACKAAAACYSLACQSGKMSIDGPFAQCAGAKGSCDACYPESDCGRKPSALPAWATCTDQSDEIVAAGTALRCTMWHGTAQHNHTLTCMHAHVRMYVQLHGPST